MNRKSFFPFLLIYCPRFSPYVNLAPVGEWLFKDPEMGRVCYTISILLMFSLVIVMLMVRSIRRTNSAIEVSEIAVNLACCFEERDCFNDEHTNSDGCLVGCHAVQGRTGHSGEAAKKITQS